MCSSYKDVQKFQDAFVGQDVQNVSRFWINNRQPVDLVFQ